MAVIDKEGSNEEVQDEVKDNGIEIAEDSEIGEALNNEAEGSDTDGRGTDKEDGKVSGKEEGAVREEEAPADEVEEESLIKSLTDKIADLEKRIGQPAPMAPEEKPESKAAPISEEEWAKYEEERGIPRTAQTWITHTLVRAVTDMQKTLDQRLARFERRDAMERLSSNPEFADAKKYSKDMDRYLEKVDPRYHSNEEVLKDALIWARGVNYKKDVQKVRNEKEVNKRISGVARPASSGGSRGGTGKSATPLTAVEKSAASAMNMSEDEYRSLKGKGRVIAR